MKINFELPCVETKYLSEVLSFVNSLTYKVGSLSTMTFTSLDRKQTHPYAIWHNKKSYSVYYTRRDNV